MYYTTKVRYKTLAIIFGIVPATISKVITRAEVALETALRRMYLARVRWPTFAQQALWAEKVQAKEPMVRGRWGFIDGKNYHVQEPSATDLQNAFYNGWLHTVFVTGTVAFGVDGCIVWMKHNIVGSWNDGDNSREFQEKIMDPTKNLPGHGVLSDSAFPVHRDMIGRIMTPPKEGEMDKLPPRCAARRYLLRLFSAITCLRQAAEWGMGAVEKVYRNLLMPLPYNQRTRQRRLEVIHRLYNFRVRTTAISEIRTVFD
jgi:hypothetical protein